MDRQKIAAARQRALDLMSMGVSELGVPARDREDHIFNLLVSEFGRRIAIAAVHGGGRPKLRD